ncbi:MULTISPECIES: ABC transporter ATP-binding protein [unclassified Leucobacter]|uniref:ATP-binding cassette domain-containing protein n=1 Tax=unclassified Leucobacter TaxID=2621730 RepID=UPI00165DF53E|nr:MULTISPECIES: ABC transporter ATP-binding protein [unclassified Leucobacter]MBC9927979.1 ABC transporter ATP-binding protein [Leucobacter sp. cx-169]
MSRLSPTPLGVVVHGLTVSAAAGALVEPLDLVIPPGRTLAIIGESGSGKSMTARAITGLLPRGVTAAGTAVIDGESTDLAEQDPAVWSRVRGRRAVLLLQDPFTSLSPVIRCGRQIGATIVARHRATGEPPLSRGEVDAEIARRLDEVRLPASVARRFPSELSGGMRQRVAIAAALAAEPRLLIADEPTTALDASTQGGVLDLLRELQQKHEMSVLLISHDLGIIGGRADEVLVMRKGQIVEQGTVERVLGAPSHPYTRALIEANPSLDDASPPLAHPGAALLSATGMTKRFGRATALHDASVDVRAGEIVAIVGESGSGKSTLARCIAGLEHPDAGSVTLDGLTLPPGRRGRTPQQMQIVFQDPYSTLNPVFTVGQALTEALAASGRSADEVPELLRLVDLDPSFAARRPSQLSGGQRQRVAIARALAPQPRVLICDESVSALDVSVQAQVLELLARLRDELGLAMLFITHDLAVVARIANRMVVLRGGEIVERGTAEQVMREPAHPYTRMLVEAAREDSVHRPTAAAPPGLAAAPATTDSPGTPNAQGATE